MSTGNKLPFDEAMKVAEECSIALTPTLVQLKAVGSLRRRLMRVGDVEFLARPHFDQDLFGGAPTPVLDPVRRVLRELGDWVKGADRQMVITNVLGHEGFKLELYIHHPPAQWGSLLAIRTGPRDLNVWCVSAMRKRGYRHDEGCVKKMGTDEIMPTPEEEDFFKFAGVPMMPPQKRDEQIMVLQQGRKR